MKGKGLKGRIMPIEEETEDIKSMLRHLHNDIELLRREQVMNYNMISGLACLLADGLCTKEDLADVVMNPDIRELKLDELYSPIDSVDKEDWKEHLRKEKEEEEKYKKNFESKNE